MTIHYFTRLEDGLPRGFWNDDAYPDVVEYGPLPEPTEDDPTPEAPEVSRTRNPMIPTDAVELTEDQYQELLLFPGLRKFAGGEVVKYTPPTPPVVHATQCTPAQGQMALYQTGHFDAFNAAVAASPYVPLQIYAKSATFWEITNPYIQAMQAELGLSDDQVQALFDLAVTL